MSSPLVSIITATYNAEKFIVDTIESVLAQTYKNWEWCIVDDGSQDNTKNLIKDYVKRDSRIHFYELSQNQGPAGARTLAMQKSKGEYVAFLDADDLWLSTKLEKQLDFMLKNNHAFSFHSYRRINEEGGQESNLLQAVSQVNYNKLLGFHAIGILTVMLKKSEIKSLVMDKGHNEDLMFWLKILRENNLTAYGLNEDLARYRVVNKSRSSNKFKIAKDVWHIYRNVEALSLPIAVVNFSKYALSSLRKYAQF